jgi:hypothetical protein
MPSVWDRSAWLHLCFVQFPDIAGDIALAVSRFSAWVRASNPTHGWGSVAHDKVGIVRRVDPDGDLKVDFPEHSGWTGKSSEMEVVTARSDRPTTNAVILIEAGSERSGSLGVIIQDDHDGTPFKVRFKDGETKWYKESQVQNIGLFDAQYPCAWLAVACRQRGAWRREHLEVSARPRPWLVELLELS